MRISSYLDPGFSAAMPRSELRRMVRENAYPGYVYGYPHKKAYRALTGRNLSDVWCNEDRSHLFCYVHVPFCNQRCSFCNLFTYVPGEEPASAAYVDALGREMALCARQLEGPRFSRLYIGGGTPTYLSTEELRRLVGYLRDNLDIDPARLQGCIECSPETLDAEKVSALRELGFRRVSLGVQSFREEELRQVNRRFQQGIQDEAIALIAGAGFEHFNIDLIYGLPGQTRVSWGESIKRAVESAATSLFLYPLYVRPLTGLGVRTSLDGPTQHEMGAMYDLAVERLAGAGFRQRTMRQFRRDDGAEDVALEYRCQSHGMLGLGAGARSYTAGLHYSTPWKMMTKNIRHVVDEYVFRMSQADTNVSYGIELDEEERRRRYVIQSLLFEGVDVVAFEQAFGCEFARCFAAELHALTDERLVEQQGGVVRLTALGVRHADIVGVVFYSERVRSLMATFEYDS